MTGRSGQFGEPYEGASGHRVKRVTGGKYDWTKRVHRGDL